MLRSALLTRLAMIWFAAARLPTVIVVPTKEVPMQTESVETGTLPELQLVGDVHRLLPAVPVQLLLPLQLVAEFSCGFRDGEFLPRPGNPDSFAANAPPMVPVVPNPVAGAVSAALRMVAFGIMADLAIGKSVEVVVPARNTFSLPSKAMPRPSSAPDPPR
jgi:hypothetical protein